MRALNCLPGLDRTELRLWLRGQIGVHHHAVNHQFDFDDSGRVGRVGLNRDVIAFVVRTAARRRRNYDRGFVAADETATRQDHSARHQHEREKPKQPELHFILPP